MDCHVVQISNEVLLHFTCGVDCGHVDYSSGHCWIVVAAAAGGTHILATSGVSLDSMFPLHLSATERAPNLLELIMDRVALPELQILSSEGWFTVTDIPGTFRWF
jgi:hypothetical protein